MAERFNSINLPEPYPDNIYRIKELELKVELLEKIMHEMASKQPVIIEKIYIKRIDADKVELKIDDIDIKKLDGKLDIDLKTGKKTSHDEPEN